MKPFHAILIAFLLGPGGASCPLRAQAAPKVKVRYRHAYYLFAQCPPGSEGGDASIPLLLTKLPLEALAPSPEENACLVIDTSERDSIFWIRKEASLTPEAIRPLERHLQLLPYPRSKEPRWYRYQEVGRAEVERLFKNPNGRIPATRPMNFESEARALLPLLDLKD